MKWLLASRHMRRPEGSGLDRPARRTVHVPESLLRRRTARRAPDDDDDDDDDDNGDEG